MVDVSPFLDQEASVDRDGEEADDLDGFLGFEAEQDKQTRFGSRFLHAAIDTL
ncbi:hypothetical protein E1B28_005255 [Marasmius oreades]|uniref:Uncharacterized protein n=1 Tax=Marasmius oreades TaxID=181124 RepID=A0A9P7V091_9AGAR|nr:uncharacterized protein E1B28_005255 [Marasmius oreades]KAG7097944.1 hypothetical protein E1B28_005255 [Marasmius oreades]